MINDSEAARLEKLLGPIYAHIREAILEAFRYRQTRYAEELSTHTARTRASLLNDLIIFRFMQRKLREIGIRVFKINNRILFDIRGELILHFKKLNGQLQSSNLQTEFAYAFTRQQELPGIPTKLLRLVAGYVPSKDWTAITGVYVTLPKGNKVEWSRSLMDQADNITNLPNQKNEIPKRQRKLRRRGGDKSNPAEETGTGGG
jgi:hypothetical protein